MIQARVTHDREAPIKITIYGNHGTTLDIMAVIDTGFSDYLTLHPDEIADLELDLDGEIDIVLANGTSERVDLYFGSVEWDGVPRSISVQSSYGPRLLGMRMLGGCTLTMDVSLNGSIAIETGTCEPFD